MVSTRKVALYYLSIVVVDVLITTVKGAGYRSGGGGPESSGWTTLAVDSQEQRMCPVL